MKLLVLYSFFPIFISITRLEDDLQNVYSNDPKFDPKCFNYTELTSETMKFFPKKCETVYGSIVINNNTDLAIYEIEEMFKNLKFLYGGIRIDNSSLINLSFIPKGGFEFHCEKYGFFIQNNPQLIDVNSLQKVKFMFGKNYEECDVIIENNAKLNAEKICEGKATRNLMNLSVRGNLKDCGCQGSFTPSESISQFKNFEDIYHGLTLSNISSSEDLSALSNIKTIRGVLNIQNTDFQNLSFLENFQLFIFNADRDKILINIQNNSKMTRLALPKFGKIRNARYSKLQAKVINFNIENLHPDFCLTWGELSTLLDYHIQFLNLHAKLCEEYTLDPMLCQFKNMAELPYDCWKLIGDVIIESGDEDKIRKLYAPYQLYGSLETRNTNLTDIEFLRFRYIVSLDEKRPVIQIIGNKNLKNPEMIFRPNIYTNGPSVAVIQDNHPDIFESSNGTCNLFKVSPKDKTEYIGSLNYTGGDCGHRVEMTSSVGARIGATILILLSVLLIL